MASVGIILRNNFTITWVSICYKVSFSGNGIFMVYSAQCMIFYLKKRLVLEDVTVAVHPDSVTIRFARSDPSGREQDPENKLSSKCVGKKGNSLQSNEIGI